MPNKVNILFFGKIKEKYLNEGILEYQKRISPFCKINMVNLKDEGIKKNSEKIIKYISPNTFLLDSFGKSFSSEEFSLFLKKSQQEITLIIGNQDGFTSEIKTKFSKISLSNMTFLHEMCLLFLLEQIYRANMIINNREYHK